MSKSIQDQRIELLRGSGGLSSLPEHELRDLATRVHRNRYEPNQLIFRKKDASTGMMVVVSGRMKITSVGITGNEVILNIIDPGHSTPASMRSAASTTSASRPACGSPAPVHGAGRRRDARGRAGRDRRQRADVAAGVRSFPVQTTGRSERRGGALRFEAPPVFQPALGAFPQNVSRTRLLS
jgi:hypothetical protein